MSSPSQARGDATMEESETRKVTLSLEMTGDQIDALKSVLIFEPTIDSTGGARLFRHDEHEDVEVRLLIINKDKVCQGEGSLGDGKVAEGQP